MNILLFSAFGDRTGVALCIAQTDAHCTLAGEVTTTTGSAHIELRELDGAVVHRATLHVPDVLGADRAAGIAHILTWMCHRNIRIDLVAHYVEHHAELDHILRLVPGLGSILAEFDACKAAVYCIDGVTAADAVIPQVVFFAVRPHTAASIAHEIAAADWNSLTNCSMKKLVRHNQCPGAYDKATKHGRFTRYT